MQFKSFFFGTDLWGILVEYIVLTIIAGVFLPYRIFEIREKYISIIINIFVNSLSLLLFLIHNHYKGNMVEFPKFYLNMEIFVIFIVLIHNLNYNSNHNFTIFKKPIKK
jgi:hypothetical protein